MKLHRNQRCIRPTRQNAKKKITPKLKSKLNFIHTSATDLPFENEAFSHVISQSTIYHIHNKQKTISEIYRVLQRGGMFIFDDLYKPKPNVSKDAQKFVYERLLFDTPFSFKTYQDELRKQGFEIIEARDEIIAIELKSVRPNSGEGRGEKQKILYGKASLKLLYPNKKIRFFVGFPFDPTSPTSTEYDKNRFFNYLIEFKKFFAHEEILIASELWDFLSNGKKTMEEILDIIAETVLKVRG